jgi:hypothetical protein
VNFTAVEFDSNPIRRMISRCACRLKNLAITPPADKLILLLAAPIAQLDRAADYGSAGYRFNSYWVHHLVSSEFSSYGDDDEFTVEEFEIGIIANNDGIKS